MEIKDFLKDIEGITDDKAETFLLTHREKIRDFVCNLWKDSQSKTDMPEVTSEVSRQMPETLACILPEKEIVFADAPVKPANGDALLASPCAGETDLFSPAGKTQEEEVAKQQKINEVKNEEFDMQIKRKHIVLPNGKVNKMYTYLFDISRFDIPEIREYWFEGLEQTGLTFNKETHTISGIPTEAGDIKIIFKCKRADWEEGKPVFERPFTLIINPDPRSLWNNYPTDPGIEYFKPDMAKEYVTVKALNGVSRKDLVAASQRGRSHAHEGKPRDDHFRIVYDPEADWYILAVADGAGSASYSRKGSQIACDTVIDICKSKLPELTSSIEKEASAYLSDKSDSNRKKVGDLIYNVLGSAVFHASKNIKKEAAEKNCPVKNYATTLLVAVCKRFDFGWFIGSFWVGDGGLGIYTINPPFQRLLGEPDGGEFAGQTRFLTMEEIVQPAELYRRLRFDIVDDFTALILMTDGVTDPKFETDSNLNRMEKWDELWQDLTRQVHLTDDNEQAASELLQWLDFWSPGNHDDRTIAILY